MKTKPDWTKLVRQLHAAERCLLEDDYDENDLLRLYAVGLALAVLVPINYPGRNHDHILRDLFTLINRAAFDLSDQIEDESIRVWVRAFCVDPRIEMNTRDPDNRTGWRGRLISRAPTPEQA